MFKPVYYKLPDSAHVKMNWEFVHKQVLGTHLVLVSGVERDLCNFLILVPHGLDGATGQFDTLQ